MNHELVWVLCLFMLIFFMRLVCCGDSTATSTLTTTLEPDLLFKKNKSKVEQNIIKSVINSRDKVSNGINLEERRVIIKLRKEVHEGTHVELLIR